MSSTTFVDRPVRSDALPSQDLVMAIDLLRSHSYIVLPPKARAADVLFLGRLRMDAEARVITFDGEDIGLSPVQARIVRVLMEHGSAWCSTQGMRQAVWPGPGPRGNALSVHLSAIRQKLRKITKLQMPVTTSRSAGLRLAASLWT